MEYELYVIYDATTNKYGIPMAQENDASAMRAFAHEAMKKESLWNSHPNDFVMYNVGTFYILTGEIIAHKPERVCSAVDFVRKEN